MFLYIYADGGVCAIFKFRLMGQSENREMLIKLSQMLFSLAWSDLLHFSNSELEDLNIVTDTLEFFLKRDPSNKNAYNDMDALAIKTKNYLHENFTRPLPSTKLLSQELVTNDFTLKRSFKNKYGCGIYQYYSNLKLEFSFSLLLESTASINDICIRSGFNDYTSFLKAFKKKFGKSPRQIRRQK